MKARICFGTGSLAALALCAATACMSTKDSTNTPAAMSEAEMQAKWTEYATPSAGHQALQQRIGKWSMVVKMTMAPGAPPVVSNGTSEHKWVMDGRFVEDTTESEVMGQPFHGKGLVGYDNLKKKYVSTWIDNMSTGVMTGQGTYDAAHKTWNFTTEQPNFASGTYSKARSVEKFTDNDHFVMQMFGPGPDGKEMMGMEIEYTRMK